MQRDGEGFDECMAAACMISSWCWMAGTGINWGGRNVQPLPFCTNAFTRVSDKPHEVMKPK